MCTYKCVRDRIHQLHLLSFFRLHELATQRLGFYNVHSTPVLCAYFEYPAELCKSSSSLLHPSRSICTPHHTTTEKYYRVSGCEHSKLVDVIRTLGVHIVLSLSVFAKVFSGWMPPRAIVSHGKKRALPQKRMFSVFAFFLPYVLLLLVRAFFSTVVFHTVVYAHSQFRHVRMLTMLLRSGADTIARSLFAVGPSLAHWGRSVSVVSGQTHTGDSQSPDRTAAGDAVHARTGGGISCTSTNRVRLTRARVCRPGPCGYKWFWIFTSGLADWLVVLVVHLRPETPRT